ncbi:MAG: hypothetical protein WC869_04340 [Phycisphaerae bacterium]|jgi:hypothetical protein
MAKQNNTLPAATLQAPASNNMPWWALAICGLVGILCVVNIWSTPRPIGDLFVGYAVGRDVMDGKVLPHPKPDDWAFTTEGRISFNQNWLTQFTHYQAFMHFGENGILALKAALLAIAFTSIVLAARERGVGWAVALVVAGGVITATRSYTDMRPNLTTLTLAPLMLWMLFKTRKSVHWIWPVMILNGLWANAHGGFIFGLGMTTFWTLCRLAGGIVGEGWKGAWKKYWPLVAGTAGSFLLATFVNPYGPENLTFPFTIQAPAWKKLNEWQPLLPNHQVFFGTAWEFLVIIGLLLTLLMLRGSTWQLIVMIVGLLSVTGFLVHNGTIPETQAQVSGNPIHMADRFLLFAGLTTVVVVLLRLLHVPPPASRAPARPDIESATLTLFDLGLMAVLVYMTITARRIVPLSVILLGPLLAMQVQWVLRQASLRWLVVLTVTAVVVVQSWYFYSLHWYVIALEIVLGLACALLVQRQLRHKDLQWLVLVPALALAVPVAQEAYMHFLLYRPENPLVPPNQSVYTRMSGVSIQPVGAAQFLADNHISGRALNEWRWEGYLHWICPDVKVFLGGRAHQVYDANRMDALQTQIFGGSKPLPLLAKLGINLVIQPWINPANAELPKLVVDAPSSPWVFIYSDASEWIAADANDPQMKEVIRKALAGELKYPTPYAACLSRAMAMSKAGSGYSFQQVIEAFMAAAEARPTEYVYQQIAQGFQRANNLPGLRAYFTQQFDRLSRMDTAHGGGGEILRSRALIAYMLKQVCNMMGDPQQAARWQEAETAAQTQYVEMAQRWLMDPLAYFLLGSK